MCFLWTMTGVQAAENHGDKWGWIWYLWWGIYTSVPTQIHSQNLLAAAEASTLKISSHGASQEHPNQHKNSHELSDEIRHLILSLEGKPL